MSSNFKRIYNWPREIILKPVNLLLELFGYRTPIVGCASPTLRSLYQDLSQNNPRDVMNKFNRRVMNVAASAEAESIRADVCLRAWAREYLRAWYILMGRGDLAMRVGNLHTAREWSNFAGKLRNVNVDNHTHAIPDDKWEEYDEHAVSVFDRSGTKSVMMAYLASEKNNIPEDTVFDVCIYTQTLWTGYLAICDKNGDLSTKNMLAGMDLAEKLNSTTLYVMAKLLLV